MRPGLDEQVELCRARPLDGTSRTCGCTPRSNEVGSTARSARGRSLPSLRSRSPGTREVLRIDVGQAEAEAFWTGPCSG